MAMDDIPYDYDIELKRESPLQLGSDAPRVTLEQMRTILLIVFKEFKDGGGSLKPQGCVRINNQYFTAEDLLDEESFEGKYVGIKWLDLTRGDE